jgi:serine/threonine protein kinase
VGDNETIAPGTELGGYTIYELLGQGGFGSVYRASRDGSPDLALKVLHRELLGHANAADRFTREIEIIRSLNHESVLAIDDFGTLPEGSPYFAMELLHGRDLHRHIRLQGRLSPESCLRIMESVCGALEVAHSRGVVHRDIKASNVFLSDDNRVVLMDFGVAKITDTPGMTLTMSRHVVGSPCAMSPEQLTGGTIDGRTDVYALGVLAYQMLTGRLPFAAASATVMNNLHRHAARPLPSDRVPGSAALDRVVTEAMSITPARRPGSPLAFLRVLRKAIHPEQSRAQPQEHRQGIRVAFSLTPLGSDASLVEQAHRALQDAIGALQPLGLETVSHNSRGAYCVCPLESESDPLVDQVYEAVKRLRPSLTSACPKGTTVDVALGTIYLQSGRIVGGPLLAP